MIGEWRHMTVMVGNPTTAEVNKKTFWWPKATKKMDPNKNNEAQPSSSREREKEE